MEPHAAYLLALCLLCLLLLKYRRIAAQASLLSLYCCFLLFSSVVSNTSVSQLINILTASPSPLVQISVCVSSIPVLSPASSSSACGTLGCTPSCASYSVDRCYSFSATNREPLLHIHHMSGSSAPETLHSTYVIF